jgi:hypothetical protein
MQISEDMYHSAQEGNRKAKVASKSCQTGTETLRSPAVGKCTYTRRMCEEIEENIEALPVLIVRSTMTRGAARLPSEWTNGAGL